MDGSLLERLGQITDEERRLLDGGGVDRSLYTDGARFTVDSRKLLAQGALITVRPHTRFVEFPPHQHDYVEMMYVCQGAVTHILGGREVRLNAGELLLLGRNTRHAIRAAGREDLGVNLIILPEFFDASFQMLDRSSALAGFLANLLRRDGGGGEYLHFRTAGVLQVQNLMENLVYSLANGIQGEEAINQHLMGLLLLYLTRYADTLSEHSPATYEDVLLRAALDYIGRHYRDASLTALARQSGMSVSALSQFLHRRTGFTFKELLQHKRFEAARRLLVTTGLAVAEIAAAVGYENNSYFHRRFREIYGISPREYRLAEREAGKWCEKGSK